jgi:hypothetical protein
MTSSLPTVTNDESKPSKTVRILIGGNHPLYLDSLARLIRTRAGFDSAGVVSSEAIVPALTDLKPDLAMLGPFERGRQ